MHAQQTTTHEKIKQNEEPSRLEIQIQQYEEPIRGIVHHLLERFVQEEFERFVGPRIGQQITRETDGQKVKDYRNGERIVKQLVVDTMVLQNFRIPRNRAGGFRSDVLSRSRRRAGKLGELALEMFVHGLGCRRIRRVFERVGVKISGLSRSSVSRISEDLRKEYQKWINRPITGHFQYLQADAVYIKIRRKKLQKPGTLIIIGIRPDGKKEVLHFTLGTESERCFDEALQSLLYRGLDPAAVALITMDGAPGPLKSAANIFGEKKIQRCTFHKTGNILEKAPLTLREELKAKLQRLWNQSSLLEAERYLEQLLEEYKKLAPNSMDCLREDRNTLLRFLEFPASHRKTIRTTNLIERVIREVRRRTKVMDTLDSEFGAYGILMGVVREQNERWTKKSHWKKNS